MSFLITCWLIIENVVIPNGFKKWFYLSFYIHPSILIFCQIFLWVRVLKDCFSFVLFTPLKPLSNSCLYIFYALRKCVTRLCSFIISPNGSSRADREEEEASEQYFEARRTFDTDQTPDIYIAAPDFPVICEAKLLEDNKLFLCYERSEVDEDSFCGSSVDSSTSDENSEGVLRRGRSESEPSVFDDVDESPPTNSKTPDFDPFESKVIGEDAEEEEEEESDEVFETYAERMRWFDILNHDRACGISAIEKNKQVETPSPLRRLVESPSEAITRRLLRSLEVDFEVVYVAQSCLAWKALHHQYMKVKAIESFAPHNGLVCSHVAGEFQKFQILLERFMEDEQSEGKRVWNYVNGRFSLKGLLQVPQVSVKCLVKKEKENLKGEGTNIKEVLKTIEQCIEAFCIFIKTDNSKRSWWQIQTSSWTYPPVEDPRDLDQLAELSKRLQKAKLWLKDLEGKKRCMLKRIVNPIEESQRMVMKWTIIDVSLVSRVLQMPMISSSQLKWCQQKLNNLEFRDGKVYRTSNDSLFPP